MQMVVDCVSHLLPRMRMKAASGSHSIQRSDSAFIFIATIEPLVHHSYDGPINLRVKIGGTFEYMKLRIRQQSTLIMIASRLYTTYLACDKQCVPLSIDVFPVMSNSSW
jgi:hypothetical protein